ncbi:hypothetical protein RHSIM_Rhsim05G0105100 [Rhododendron simsii]|uniref:Uncharacterized protein n=1 Tax=Rhododendron simsii TaxID=118357 RepID=A0A834LMN0_RHOSS|nr:hypothetical protein RHSIM_Rhsim05G0105100 [Rhododendron simsii]
MENLPEGKAHNMAELCLFIAKAGQCASRAYRDMDSLLERRRSLRGELKIKREEAKAGVDEVMKLERSVAEVVEGLVKRDRLLTEV